MHRPCYACLLGSFAPLAARPHCRKCQESVGFGLVLRVQILSPNISSRTRQLALVSAQARKSNEERERSSPCSDGMTELEEPCEPCLRSTLERALCIQRFASTTCERHHAPEVETQDVAHLLLDPVLITSNGATYCIEPSINSVRISIQFHQDDDDLKQELTKMYTHFLMQRADALDVLRRVPMDGYDISFLVTNHHLLRLGKAVILELLCSFAEQVSTQGEEMKQAIRLQGKSVANEFLRGLAF